MVMGRGGLSPDLLQSHGAFGRFPPSALQRGARMLERAAAAHASSTVGTSSSGGGGGTPALSAGQIQDLVRAASEDDSMDPSEPALPTSTAKPLFRITQHLRGWDAVVQTEDDILSNFASISVVAAAPAATRDAIAEALRVCISRSEHVGEEGGRRLYAMPFIRDVFVAEPLP